MPRQAIASPFADEPRIDNVIVSLDNPLKATFVVKNAFSDEIFEAVQSGIPTTFRFIVRLEKANALFPNEVVTSREYRHTVRYDNLKEEYAIYLEERGESGAFKLKGADEMKKAMTSSMIIIETPVRLDPKVTYELRIMAEMQTIRLPFLLDYMLFFLKFWDFKTDWHIYRFSL